MSDLTQDNANYFHPDERFRIFIVYADEPRKRIVHFPQNETFIFSQWIAVAYEQRCTI